MGGVDLLVVGGGAIGLATAWRGAQRGLRVRVVERDRPGAGASTAAAGILAPLDPPDPDDAHGAFTLAAMAGWEAFAAELQDAAGDAIGFRRAGALRVARDHAECVALEAAAAALDAAGTEHEVLGAAGCAAEEPGLHGAVAGLLTPDVAQVDTERLVAALVVAARRAGVAIDAGLEPVAALPGPDGAVAGVRLSDGSRQPAALTLVAAGAWSARAAWLPEAVRPPVRPLAGEHLLLRAAPGVPPPCRRIVRTIDGSVAVRDGGRCWVGTTVRAAGYVALPEAGALRDVLARATALLPALASLGVERAGVGLRPGTPDGLPIVGPAALDGLAVATGHGREGIVHAPATAAAVAGLAAGLPLPASLARFSPQRPALAGTTLEETPTP